MPWLVVPSTPVRAAMDPPLPGVLPSPVTLAESRIWAGVGALGGVLFIVMADQLSALALGCYRNPAVKSPNIDQLANEGIKFEKSGCRVWPGSSSDNTTVMPRLLPAASANAESSAM